MAEDEVILLIGMLESKRGGPGVRAQAARTLGERGDPRAIEPLLNQIEDTTDPFRVPVVTAVLEALPLFGEALQPPLMRILDSPHDFRRRYVPRLLMSARGVAAAPTLVSLLKDSDEEVVLNAATSLGLLRTAAFAAPLLAMVGDLSRSSLQRGMAASALGMSGSIAAYDVLVPLLETDDASLVAGAIDGLAELGDPRSIPLLQALLARGHLDARTIRGAKLALMSLRAHIS